MEETKIVDAAAVVGGKRKNGHKMDCSCHICENMTKKAKRGGYKADAEKRMLQKMGGSKKKNGHKMDCGCPICKNMKNAKQVKRGGGDIEEVVEKEMMVSSGGRKKKGNGHKLNCGCPICKNMKKSKRGGEDPEPEPDIESGNRGDIEEGIIPPQKTKPPLEPPKQIDNRGDIEEGIIPPQKTKPPLEPPKQIDTSASNDDYDSLDAAEKGEAGPNVVGGTRKRRGAKKSARKHKSMGRKTRRHRKRTHKRH